MKRSAVASLALLLVSAPCLAQGTVRPDRQNVVAPRLGGVWAPDTALTRRLRGDLHAPDTLRADPSPAGRIVFRSDTSVAPRVPARFIEQLKSRQADRIYMSGYLEMGGKEYPFILISISGNPHVVMFRAVPKHGVVSPNADPFEDAESFNVMLGVAKEPMADLLLIGGDFNNQPFSAFKRISVTTGR